jgi:hypothetical protein
VLETPCSPRLPPCLLRTTFAGGHDRRNICLELESHEKTRLSSAEVSNLGLGHIGSISILPEILAMPVKKQLGLKIPIVCDGSWQGWADKAEPSSVHPEWCASKPAFHGWLASRRIMNNDFCR